MKLRETKVIKHMTVRIGGPDSYEFAKIGLEEIWELEEGDDPIESRQQASDIVDQYLNSELGKLGYGEDE